MRIDQLTIDEFRGIRHFTLNLEGASLVVWGPNGSGKSAVVDALDFLLTGRITRLTGRGTGELRLEDHGPHLGADVASAVVSAQVRFEGVSEAIQISRSVAHPGTLTYPSKYEPVVAPALAVAARGHHVLTRREILRFITAEAGNRADELQRLLNLADLEKVREALVRAEHDAERSLAGAKRSKSRAVNDLAAEAGMGEIGQQFLTVVNEHRRLLGGQPISAIAKGALVADLGPYSGPTSAVGASAQQVQSSIQAISVLVSDSQPVKVAYGALLALFEQAQSSALIAHAIEYPRLTELGISLLDESGRCPLCDTQWDINELHAYLHEKLTKSQEATKLITELQSLIKEVVSPFSALRSNLSQVIAAAHLMIGDDAVSQLTEWKTKADQFESSLRELGLQFRIDRYPLADVGSMLAPQGAIDLLERVRVVLAAQTPQLTPEQNARIVLIRMEVRVETLEAAGREVVMAERVHNRARALHTSFLQSRDSILKDLYNSIRDRFVELYLTIHRDHEGDFKAELGPDNAGVRLEVGFYDQGLFPPHAVHSEGHQDSMGICLFLALSELFASKDLGIVALDDVMMSVDGEHRRAVSRLLKEEFPNTQFVITTHDRSWARQLRTDGVVNPKHSVHFSGWSLQTGPHVDGDTDAWHESRQLLESDKVAQAAGVLRKGLEDFFEGVCDAIKAKVTYNSNRQWTYGDYVKGAYEGVSDLLKRAKAAENSWNHRDQMEKIDESHSLLSQAYARTRAEEWVNNHEIHFNLWDDLVAEDFLPVLAALEDLRASFVCSGCKELLHLVEAKGMATGLKCACGQTSFNLTAKEK